MVWLNPSHPSEPNQLIENHDLTISTYESVNKVGMTTYLNIFSSAVDTALIRAKLPMNNPNKNSTRFLFSLENWKGYRVTPFFLLINETVALLELTIWLVKSVF